MTAKPGKLQQEIAAYEAHRAELVEKHNGEFVLIKGDDVIDCFKTEAEAMSAGYARYLNEPFLVRPVAEAETPVFFTSLYLGRQCPT